ncbi:MAG TPA: homoserine dehydrogenase, partial [Ramlibacter sp.]|nr:homoserine dehydrogenase [Ramlibacter sp.]
NQIEWLAGIVNGTSNFVLTQMRDHGRRYDDALREAQALGYAEADPALDVDGGDAAHKLALLAAMAFGGGPRLPDVHVEGIRGLQPADFTHAARLGHTIKLLAVARRGAHGLQLRVHPALVPIDGLLARVDGRMNGIVVKGDASGVTMYYGAGAGSRETASAVVADLVDLARALRQGSRICVPPLGFYDDAPAPQAIEPLASLRLAQYFRIPLATPDAAQHVLQALSRHGIEPAGQVQVPPQGELALLTAPADEACAAAAAQAIAALPGVCGKATRLRVEALG